MDDTWVLDRLVQLAHSYDFVDLMHDSEGWLLLAGGPEISRLAEGNTSLVDCIQQAYEKHLELKRG